MKVCIPTGSSGHLTEVLFLIEVFEGHDVFFIAADSPRARTLTYRTYLFPWGLSTVRNLGRLLINLPRMATTLWRERPDILFSTGAEFAVPFLYIGRLLGAKIVFVESVTRVHTPTVSGRLVYPISDLFLVQHPEVLSRYGRKARYAGGIV
jgi:beta-1,4-N-acetylglucosaminyltransferase